MISKILMGVAAASAIALAIVFSMLLSAKEANGVLRQGVDMAAGVNAKQAATITALQRNTDKLLDEIELQQKKANQATEAMVLAQSELVAAGVDFDQRLKTALEGMTNEELVCSAELVPDELISLFDSDGP